MAPLKIPVGISDFKKLREDGYYYIDKSGLIADLLTNNSEVTLITRPRRFGKTLAMSMLANFFDIRKKSQNLFTGLQIESRPDLCQAWMNQFPTLFLTFKDVDGLDYASARDMLRSQIARLCNEHSYLADSPSVNENDRKEFIQLADIVDGKPTDTMLKTSILLLMRMMQAHFQKPVILLLDEYDVPLAKASANGYYPQMLELMKSLMSTALKDNSTLRFASITGCLKIAKESIFTGTNNFVSDTISSSSLDEYFGFTQADMEKLLLDADMLDRDSQIKAWYDGYHFGASDVYCPWDVMNYLLDCQKKPDARPIGYWKNTSDNAIIRSFIDYAGSNITMKLEALLSGGYILQHVEENLTYDYLHSSEDNLWSILYLTGYLTQARIANLPDGLTALMIPNAEIREIFESTILKWFNDSAKTWNREQLFYAVWHGNTDLLTQEMNALLRMTISYHDYKEDFYHAFLAGIFAGAGYVVESNREHGEGRSDVIVYDLHGGRMAIFEAKYSKTLKKLSDDCDNALRQIDERMYAKEFEGNYDEIFCYGISFFKKRCMVKGIGK
ncbi:AAA family ATPase [Clostridium sp.]|uniref:AAA family ATPase n=1 Tax=Clostridium sp. TaxID=1506 RepID=UPI0035215D5D